MGKRKQKPKKTTTFTPATLGLGVLILVLWTIFSPRSDSKNSYATPTSFLQTRAPVSGLVEQPARRTPTATPTAESSGSGSGIVTATPLSLRTITITVLVDVLNLRAGPSTDYSILGTLGRGAELRITGQSADGMWYVAEREGQRVWLSAQPALVQINGNPDGLRVMQAPQLAAPAATRPPAANTRPAATFTAPPAGPAAPAFVCPRNCSTAVAAGISEIDAAKCPRLDADQDGKACYGD